MKRVWNIIGRVVVWLCIVAFFVVATLLRRQNEATRVVDDFRVVVADSSELSLVGSRELEGLIVDEGLDPTGKSLDSITLLAINNAALSHSFVSDATTYVDYDNVVTLEVSQRQPIARFELSGGYSFYITSNLYVLPVRRGSALDLPIITGDFTPPFDHKFEGDLRALISANKKNSDKNYIFLCKLINFVRYTECTPEWRDRIVQIVLKQRGKGAFRTTVAELVPRYGNYIVELGPLDNLNDKLDRWQRFVDAQVVKLDKGRLSLEYDNQAVWCPEPEEKPTAKKGKK